MIRAALLLAFVCAPQPRTPEVFVELKTVNDELVCTVHTSRASAAEILTEIASKSSRELIGLDTSTPGDAIPVWLDERPLSYVVHTVAASAGWRVNVRNSRIELRCMPESEDPQVNLEQLCRSSYERAVQSHPDHPLAAEAELVLGAIRERNGDLRVAEGHYKRVIARKDNPKETPEALLRSGLIEEKLDNWKEAAELFRTLANLPQEHPYRVRARLEIARCLAQSGDPRAALFTLDALELVFPAKSTSDRQARMYVRARALLGAKRESEAIQTLRDADALGHSEEWDTDAMELRAEALAFSGRNAEAGRAWLAYAEKAVGDEKLRGWVNAAEQAREAGDTLAVLCVLRMAKGTRAETRIAGIAEEARKELGLSGNDDPALGGDLLAQAEALIDQQKTARALTLLEPLYQRREERPADARLELVVLYARALAAEKDVDAGVAELRRNLDAFPDAPARKRLCSAAGEIFEAAERYDEAYRAFGGQL